MGDAVAARTAGSGRLGPSRPLARARWAPASVRAREARREIEERSPGDAQFRASLVDCWADLPSSLPSGRGASRSPADTPVWWYWADGVDQAPALVRRCLESVQAHRGEHPVVVLDRSTWSSYVDLPEHVLARRGAMTETHFSDILRTALLASRGGVWLDATVLLTAPLEETSRLAGPSGFYAFTRPCDPFVMSSWCMAAAPGNALVAVLRDLLSAYWRRHDELGHYFLLHFLAEVAMTMHRPSRRIWEGTPVRSFEPPHELQHALGEPFDPARLDRILRGSGVHKLNWRVEEQLRADGRDPGGTFLEAVVRGDVTGAR
ncbi:capsular polysaccharide synthesis protein [Cellulomonas fimi]|uniref:capsular polysaccharide synthesis protein n=1 Tax=Cellulomonas fimi TaxID=1708 RepID=UPI0023585ACA|nr:capsular polysaccharide synthesis protein [Cellulomonas fimi]